MATAISLLVRMPRTIRRRPGRERVVTPVSPAGSERAIQTLADPTLVRALARPFRYRGLLDQGGLASINAKAAAEKIELGYLGSLLWLTLLAPDFVEARLNGPPPAVLGLPRRLAPFPAKREAPCFQRAKARSHTPPGPSAGSAAYRQDRPVHTVALAAAGPADADDPSGIESRPAPGRDKLDHAAGVGGFGWDVPALAGLPARGSQGPSATQENGGPSP